MGLTSHISGMRVRLRLTLLYGPLFLLSGAVLLTITYLLVSHRRTNVESSTLSRSPSLAPRHASRFRALVRVGLGGRLTHRPTGLPALRRRAPAGGHRPCGRGRSGAAARRRADRKPRLGLRCRRDGAAARAERGGYDDPGHHARPRDRRRPAAAGADARRAADRVTRQHGVRQAGHAARRVGRDDRTDRPGAVRAARLAPTEALAAT